MKYSYEFEKDILIVSDVKGQYKVDLKERLLEFAVDSIKFLSTIPYKKEYEVFRYQLSKSATSIGANYEESQASTKKEFHFRVSICLREARESNYWYKVIDKLDIGETATRKRLLQESKEIKLIFGTIESKTRLKTKDERAKTKDERAKTKDERLKNKDS